MHPFHYPILADENIREEVVQFLRFQNVIVETVAERNMKGSADEHIISLAEKEGKVILTHDADFGRILHLSQIFSVGIIYLRPGHIDVQLTIQTIKPILQTELQVQIPFILVAEHSADTIKLRLRNLS